MSERWTLIPLSRLATILASAGVATTLLVSAYVYYQTARGEEEAGFSQAAVFAESLAQRARIARSYLRAVAARVRDSELRLNEFEDFVDSLGPEPALELLYWLPRVEGNDRAIFERTARQQGSVGFSIRDRAEDGTLVPAGHRSVYFPIRFTAGNGEHTDELGLDLAVAEGYRHVMARTLDAGRTQASRPRRLQTGHPGFLIVEPVTRTARGDDASQIEGFVTGIFRLDLLIAAASPAPLITRNVVIQDLDIDSAPLIVRNPDAEEPDFAEWPFQDIRFGGRTWRVFLAPPEGHALLRALIVALIGFALTGLTAVLADRSQQRLIANDLRREVARQTAAFQRSTAEFRALFEEGGTGKCEIVPQSQHFRRVNRRLCEMLGQEQEALLRLKLDDVLHPEDRISDEPHYQDLLAGKADTYFAEKRFLRSDGNELWCEVSATVLRDSSGRPVWTVAVIQDIAERKQAEEARHLLVRELAHRVKNTLQVARSLADQTGRYSRNLDEFLALYHGRLRALAMAHDQLFKTDWAGARVSDVVSGTLATFGQEVLDRVDIEVPDTLLGSSETQTLALILNELATNATKHGALLNGTGLAKIRASVETNRVDGNRQRWLNFEWTEIGGPPISEPERNGFGMTFLTRAVQHQHGGSTGIEWRKDGLRYTMNLPLHEQAGD